MYGELYRGFESHPLRHLKYEVRTLNDELLSYFRFSVLTSSFLYRFDLSGFGHRAIVWVRTPPGRERSNGSRSRMCRGLSGA